MSESNRDANAALLVIDGMDRFETVLNFVLEDKLVDKKGEIMLAASILVIDAAEEMAKASLDAIAILLLTAYKTGQYAGQVGNPHVQELFEVLAKAGRDNASQAAETGE